MSVIEVKNLTFCYEGGTENVFDNVSFRIDSDHKLGVVGRNGKGKTTLLKLLAGMYEYRGSITSSTRFSYFPYDVGDRSRTGYEILQSVCPFVEDCEIFRELSYMNVDPDILFRPFDGLSGGEQTKVLLAALFVGENGFPLIDEPTNHLDGDGRIAVAEYLGRKKGFILVSHDRAFLDGCVDHILAINRSDIEVCCGNFSSWFENFNRCQALERAKNERLKKEIFRLEQSARRTSAWADKTESGKYGVQSSGLKADRGFVRHKSAKLMKRAKTTEARIEKAVEEKSALLKNTESCDSLKLFPLSCRAERIAEFSDVSICYGGKTACEVDFELMRGMRIALDGCNGCGKSSVLKLLIGENIEHKGKVFIASGLKISYVAQQTDGMRGSLSDYAREYNIDETLFKTILRKMDFSRELFIHDIGEYSQGQKKKVALARSLCESAHLYVWDEPLNYLDVYSRMQIEKLIAEFAPTMIFVEHDAAFRTAVATAVIRL